MPGIQSLPVSLIVQDDIIVFGSTIHLLCTLDDSLDLTKRRARLWFRGSEKKALCFNGFPSDPNTRQFRLTIFNTSKSDVNCYYKCAYGFEFDEKMLDLNTTKYQYIPAADEINTEINYSQEDKHITASLTFQNIYPLPQCMLSVGRSKLNMTVSRKAQHGLFYLLSMFIDYTWEDNFCRTETKIECFIGERRLPIWKTQPEQCLEMTTETTRGVDKVTTATTWGVDKVTTATTWGVDKAIVIAVSDVLVLLVCGTVLIVVLLWLRKRRAGNGETHNSKETCELVVHPIVTVGELEQKEKPMEKIGLWGTKPPNGIHNGHNERLENCKLLDWKCTWV